MIALGELGEFLGSVTGILFFLALLNYPVKFINKRWISKLPKDSGVKKTYLAIMKFLVQKHRFFALGALATVAVHLYIQLTYRWLSVTGLVAAGLLLFTVLLGANLFFRHKGKRGLLFQVHRLAALSVLVAFAIHYITRI